MHNFIRVHAHTHTHLNIYARAHTHTHTQFTNITGYTHLQEVVKIYDDHQMDLYLMEYMKTGGPPKKKGVRGDSDKPFDYHSEL